MNDSINHSQFGSRMTVAVVGSGNVATHLVTALKDHADVSAVDPHTLCGMPPLADVILIAVKDSAIAEVAEKLHTRQGIVAHTSGSVPMSALSPYAGRYGVFYPLQTFTKGVELDYSEIPFFIEGDSPQTVEILVNLASAISHVVREASSADRKVLHLASVFACNFSNCMIGIADDILRGNGMDHTLLLPLLKQTVSKLDTLSPSEAQTGPAAREDYPVMESHAAMLRERHGGNLAGLYQTISKMIIDRKTSSHK